MSEAFNIDTKGEGSGDGFAAVASIVEEGFLGTGYSATVEISFLAMGLILCWVTYETSRYVLAITGLGEQIVEKLGLRRE